MPKSNKMEQNVQKEFAQLDAGLTNDEKKGRFDIKYKMTSGKHVIIELKRANRVEDAYRSYQAFLDKNREAGRVYRLIRHIETEAHRAN